MTSNFGCTRRTAVINNLMRNSVFPSETRSEAGQDAHLQNKRTQTQDNSSAQSVSVVPLIDTFTGELIAPTPFGSLEASLAFAEDLLGGFAPIEPPPDPLAMFLREWTPDQEAN